MSLAPIDLVSAHRWERVTFTTYALSLSFFEAVVLDALIRGGARQALILADVQGVRASLSEQGAQRVGKDYNVEPVNVSSGRAFHPKISVFSDQDDSHVLVGSGNLTFNGWGGNVEVLEHLHPSFAADAIADTAEFFELLPVTERVRFGAQEDCAAIAADLRRSVQGKPANGNIRLLHNLDKSISDQLFQMVDDLGGATRLIAAAPFWDQGAAIDGLCKAMGLDHLYIHSHPHGTVEGSAGSNWPFDCRSKVHPILLEVMDGEGKRRLHAKAFEVMCKRGRILVSGSANGTAAALEEGRNVEACVVRIQRDSAQGWKFKPSEPPEPLAALDEGNEEEEENRGVLRAVLDGDEIHGEILTPAMSGVVSAFYVSSLAPEPLGKVTLSADRRFQISAASLEKKSWQAGRLVIRVEDQHGRQAEGFVSVASFADISKRAGIVARKLMAVLNGTETPADVAAIMSWFYEDPNRLALSAPINYGPGLKMLGWVERHPKYPGVLIPTPMAGPALDAFESRMAKHLGHSAFSEFGAVTVTAGDALIWQKSWALDTVTQAEAKTMAGLLFGAEAPKCRQLAGEMILRAVAYSSTADTDRLRRTMAGKPSRFTPSERLQETWKGFRILQVRQLFRLSLEALFYWMLGNLHDKPKGTDALVDAFIAELKPTKQPRAGAWLKAMLPTGTGPTELMKRIEEAMDTSASGDMVPAIAAGLAFCLDEPPPEELRIERHERLPLSRARAEAKVQKDRPVQEFLRHVFESWVLAQHVYWSVGRGLADARAQVRVLLRLKVILDEGGWTLSPGLSRGRPPVPTADRLHTVVSLSQESGLISKPSS